MPRIVKEHQQRKNEILDTAQRLFYSQGYENTSVANVIEAIGIAKGTFYHYFKSKAELLDQIIERLAQMIDQIIDRVLEEPEENAIVELNNIYAAIGEYKAENKDVMLLMTQALYSDENIVLRSKLTKIRIKTVAPKIARVISRGISEGLFHTENPDYIAEMILTMGTYLSDEFAQILLQEGLNSKNKKNYLEKCRSFENAVERILRAPKGAITFCNRNLIDAFFEN
jgi:AcrR family transcriptional regulator